MPEQRNCPKCSSTMIRNTEPNAVTAVRISDGKANFLPASGIPVWAYLCPSCQFIELYGLTDAERQTGQPQ